MFDEGDVCSRVCDDDALWWVDGVKMKRMERANVLLAKKNETKNYTNTWAVCYFSRKPIICLIDETGTVDNITKTQT